MGRIVLIVLVISVLITWRVKSSNDTVFRVEVYNGYTDRYKGKLYHNTIAQYTYVDDGSKYGKLIYVKACDKTGCKK